MIRSERFESAQTTVSKLLSETAGLELNDLDHQASFSELGFDSLFLVQFTQKIKNRLKVKVTFRQLIEEIPNIRALLEHVAEHLPDEMIVSAKSPATEAQSNPASTLEQPGTAVAQQASSSQSSSQVVAVLPSASPQNVDGVHLSTAPGQGTTALRESVNDYLVAPVIPLADAKMTSNQTELAKIISQQNQLMSLQLQLLAGSVQNIPTHRDSASSVTETASPAGFIAETLAPQSNGPTPAESLPAESLPASTDKVRHGTPSPHDTAHDSKLTRQRFGPYKPVRLAADGGLTDHQQHYLNALISRFTQRTAKSRQHAERHRPHFADPRGVAGYRRIWKSMVYQIAVEKSKGSKLWDIDGNEYIDIAMGFGLNLFGQSPDFITQAIQRQLQQGVEVGPQSPLAGEVAQLLCDFARKDRATFCNTGSEAVMAAMRLARTVTGKSKVVFFNKDYHGNFDQVLIRSNRIGQQLRSQPAAPGVPQALADISLVLDYGTDEALQVIQQHADDIAAVLIEPVQSANPFLQPGEFLHKIRQMTRENRIAMIMDEVISGFRAAPGGAQEWYGVWGDMATYGKILGGGLPIGALAGTNEYMDALDGGHWRFEDDSQPEADMTFFAGTFVRHPLAMAAAHQVLMKLKDSGPELQMQLTEKTTYLADSLNRFFEQELFPFRVAQFTSLFRFMFPPEVEYADLLYYHMLDRGIFTRGFGDNCFLSTAHSDHDIERIIQATKESCHELREGGFFPKPDVDAIPRNQDKPRSQHEDHSTMEKHPAIAAETRREDGPQVDGPQVDGPQVNGPQVNGPQVNGQSATETFPLAPVQLRYLNRKSPNPHHWNISTPFESSIPIDPTILRAAFSALIAHHNVLRLRLVPHQGGWLQRIESLDDELPFESIDLTSLDDAARQEFVRGKSQQLQCSLSLTEGPMVRLTHFFTRDNRPDIIVLVAHHFSLDMLSYWNVVDDLQTAYHHLENKLPVKLTPPESTYPTWVKALDAFANSPQAENFAQDWLKLPWGEVRPLPRDMQEGPEVNTNQNAREVKFSFDPAESAAILKHKRYFAQELLLALLHRSLSKWSGQNTILIDAMHHGRDAASDVVDVYQTAGMFLSYVPVVLQAKLEDEEYDLQSVISQIRQTWDDGWTLDALRHLSRNPNVSTKLRELPVSEVLFNYAGNQLCSDSSTFLTPLKGLDGYDRDPTGKREHSIAIFMNVQNDRLQGVVVYCSMHHQRSSIEALVDCLRSGIAPLVGGDTSDARSDHARSEPKVPSEDA